jgi:MFS transporter, DHA3 family, macrolide efflux protein
LPPGKYFTFMFSVLKNRSFFLLWSGQVISQIGNSFNYIALAWLVLTLTGSAVKMGGVLIAQLLPNALFGIFLGVLVDRLRRRELMIFCDVTRALLVLSLPLLYVFHRMPLWYVYLNVFLVSSLSLLFSSAEKSLIPALVKQDELTAANAFQEMTSQFASLIGPVLAGVLVAMLSSSIRILYIDAATFIVSAVTIFFVTVGSGSGTIGESLTAGSFFSDAREGFVFLKEERLLLIILLTAMIVNFSCYPFMVVLPVYVREVLKSSAVLFGILMGSFGGGMLCGSLLASFMCRKFSARLIIYGGMAIVGLVFISFAFVKMPLVAGVFALLAGLVIAPGNVVILSLVQLKTPDILLGRVFTLNFALSALAAPAGVALATLFMGLYGPSMTFMLMGLMVLLTALCGVLDYDRVKK